MVDEKMSLTFSVRNNPGWYALHLGSGVSTGAGIPTGWNVVEDFLRKLATAEGEEFDSDRFAWYEAKYNESGDNPLQNSFRLT